MFCAASSSSVRKPPLRLGVALQPFRREPLLGRDGLVGRALHAFAHLDEGADDQLVDLGQPRRVQQRIDRLLDRDRARAPDARHRLAAPARPFDGGLEGHAPAIARLRWPSRVGAVARSSIRSRSPCDSTRPTPSLSHHSASGLPSTPCTHEPPRSSGAPSESSVQVRPPMRLRASSTVTAKPESCSRRAATRPAMPAPTTITRSALAVPMDHEPVMPSTRPGSFFMSSNSSPPACRQSGADWRRAAPA